MLSALMGYSQATNASEVTLSDDSAEVTREIDGGLQTIKISLPAIVTTDLRLNEPRYASLPNIMKAKKKELNVVSLSEMGFDTSVRTELLSVELPAQRAAGIIVESVDEPDSLSLTASSKAISQNGFTDIFTLLRSTLD